MALLRYSVSVEDNAEGDAVFETRPDMEYVDINDIHISTVMILAEAFSTLIASGEILDRSRELAPVAMKVIDDARED